MIVRPAVVLLAPLLVTSAALAQGSDLERRVRDLERRVEALERKLATGGETAGGAGGKEGALASNSPIRVRLQEKRFREADVLAGDTIDRLVLTLLFENGFDSDVRAFAGVVVFKDPFDQEVLRLRVTEPDGVPAGARLRWEGWIGYHDFNEAHRRLRNLKVDDTSAEFLLEKVVFADGSRKSYPVAEEGPAGPPLVAERLRAAVVPGAAEEPAAPSPAAQAGAAE